MAPTATSELIIPTSQTSTKPTQTEETPNTKTPLAALSHGHLSLPGIPKFIDLSTKRQWQLHHLAAAFRHWSHEGYVEGFSGHISVRDPEYTSAFWTNPLGVHFGLLKAGDMILLNYSGEAIGGNLSRPANSAGFLIHAAVHKKREDVHAVCHAHSIYGKAWSVFGKKLDMLTQDACKFYGDAQSVYNAHGGVVLAAEEGDNIAEALGNSKAAILRNHGLLTVGGTVDEAAWLFTSMERSCKVQLLVDAAEAQGREKVVIGDREARFNFEAESEAEVCYAEFQVYYEWEERISGGDFKE